MLCILVECCNTAKNGFIYCIFIYDSQIRAKQWSNRDKIRRYIRKTDVYAQKFYIFNKHKFVYQTGN